MDRDVNKTKSKKRFFNKIYEYKKILIYLIGIIILIGIIGCDADEETSYILFNSLKSQKLIDEDFNFVETVIERENSLFITRTTYYIYEDSNDNYLAIQYSSCNGDNTCDSDYKVKIYDASLTNDDIIYIDDISGEERYYIFDNKYSKNNKYDLTCTKAYYATKKYKLFKGNYYSFELYYSDDSNQ